MMNNYPHDCGNAGLVQKFIGTAYQTVKFVADNMHYIKTIYDMLTQYNMLACVESVEQLKNIDAKQVRFARIYELDGLEKRYVDYAFIDNDESGIKPNGIQYSGSWIKVGTSSAGTGGDGSRDIAWVYNNGSAQGGEESIIVPEQTAAVTCIYVNGNYQYPRLGFEYDELSQTIRLAQPLEEGDTVIAMLSGLPADPETPNVDNFKYFNWVYNNGKANGGEQTFRPPYNFKTVVAVFINGLRKEPQYHFTWNSEGLVQLREPVKENDFVVIQIGGDVHSLLLPNVMSGYTFKGGATLRTINDHIYDSVSKKWYQWIGAYPKRINENTVAADQINTDGGIWSEDNPLGLWISLSNSNLNNTDKGVKSSYNGTIFSDYALGTISKKYTFKDGGVISSSKEGILHTDGFYYVRTSGLPFTLVPNSVPDENYVCCGTLSGYELYNVKNFKNNNSDNDALTKCLAFNKRALIDADTTLYLTPFVITEPVHITINGAIYANAQCPDLTVLISSNGVSNIRIDGVGKIDGNESVVTSSKMRLIHLIGGSNHTIEGITLTNNYIEEVDYGAYSDSTIWVDGGSNHSIRNICLIDCGMEGISVTSDYCKITGIYYSNSFGKENGTRCKNYSAVHTLGNGHIVDNVTAINTGATAVGIDSTNTIVSNINVDEVRFSHGVGLGHPDKFADGSVVTNVVVRNLKDPSSINAAGVSVGSGSKNIKVSNVTVINGIKQGINISGGADKVDVSNVYAENCEIAFSMYGASCTLNGLRVNNCRYGISKNKTEDVLILNNVNLTGATTKLIGAEENYSGTNVIFDDAFPRQAVVAISNVTRPVEVTNPNIRPWSTLSLLPLSANSASALPFATVTYGKLTINTVTAPTHYAGVKYYIS